MKKLILIIMLMLVLPISIVKADKVDKVIYQTSFETEEERNFWDLTGDLAGDGNVWQYKSSEQNADYTAQDGIYSLYFTGISEEYYSESLAISNPITINNFNPDRQHIKLNWYVSYSGRTIYPYSVYIFKGDETTENIISAVKYIGDYQGVFSSLISNAYYYKWVDITDKLNEWYPDDSEEKTIRIVFKSSMLSGTEVKIDAVSIGIYAGLEIKNYTFEDGLEGWTPIDYDGDGHNWEISYDKLANNGGNYITSASYDFEAFTPENYIISPKIKIDSKYDEVKLEWYVGARSDEYFKEHYSVYVYSGTEELTKDNVKEQLADESISQKLHEETLSTYEFVLKTSQLDEKFIGKEVQIIFVHH
ncbi:MAG: hypothetical protein IJA94_00810, partial [Bacilli bacterium]|nr:hypothetical protein [Bacilli bacterium]